MRDAFMGRRPQDLDVATDATPEALEKLFPRTVPVGKSFGVIRILIENVEVEVATFRQDGEYKDGRRPGSVTYATPQIDAQRRDFTVNAIFLEPSLEVALDFVEGEKDIEAGILRTVGQPLARFSEDYLRILRAVRFVGQLGFTIEPETFAAIQKLAKKVLSVSVERLQDEMTKLLATPYRERSFIILQETGLMKILFPFREGNLSFLPIPTRKSWHLWSLFFLPLLSLADGVSALKREISTLRFSNHDKECLNKSFQILREPEKFFKRRFGEKLLDYAEEPTRWACQVLVFMQTPFQEGIEELHVNWLKLDEQLPAPFLSGNDLKDHLQGIQIGVRLREAYVLQLEGHHVDREEALLWLKVSDE